MAFVIHSRHSVSRAIAIQMLAEADLVAKRNVKVLIDVKGAIERAQVPAGTAYWRL